MRALDVEILNGRERLAALEDCWWDLFGRVERAPPFQSPAWLLPWAECFAREDAVRAIAVRSRRGLIALLPLVLASEAGRTIGRALGHGVSDYLDALVDPVEGSDALRPLSEGLRRISRDVDAIELSDVPRDSMLPKLELGGRRDVCAVCPRLELRTPYEAYLETLPRWLARNLRQGESRLRRAGASHAVAGRAELDVALEAFFELHGARFGARGEPGVLSEPAIRDFHRRAAPRLLERELLELHTCSVEGRAVASAYVLIRRDAHLYLTGFAPEFERCSAGSVVIGRTIARATRTGRRYYDFLRGAEPYKYAWGAADVPTTCLAFPTAERRSHRDCLA